MYFHKSWINGGYEVHWSSGVPVYVDGKKAGTAKTVVTHHEGYDGPISRVELTEFSGQVYRELRKENEKLKARIEELKDRGVADGDDVQYWHRRWEAAERANGKLRELVSNLRLDPSEHVPALQARNEKIKELEAQVERLKESRKEQAEKHKQKMRNLQQNFEHQSNAKARSTKLKKDLENAKSYSHRVERINHDLRGQVDELQAKLDSVPGRDTYWHEKYLESERAVADLSESRKRLYDRGVKLGTDLALSRNENKKLIDDYNRLNDDINRFMDNFSEGANAINRAAEDWNATVPE